MKEENPMFLFVFTNIEHMSRAWAGRVVAFQMEVVAQSTGQNPSTPGHLERGDRSGSIQRRRGARRKTTKTTSRRFLGSCEQSLNQTKPRVPPPVNGGYLVWVRRELVEADQVGPKDCFPVSRFQKLEGVLKRVNLVRDLNSGDCATITDVVKRKAMADGGRWVWQPELWAQRGAQPRGRPFVPRLGFRPQGFQRPPPSNQQHPHQQNQ
jgi:hypothetical protein